MSETITQAAMIAYEYIAGLTGKPDIKMESNIRLLTGYEGSFENRHLKKVSSYEEAQYALSTLNEREAIRKKKGVYYTPADVVHFIVCNTIKSSLGILSENNISNTDIDVGSVDELCLNKKIFEPTCGAGEFLLEALEIKLNLWENAHGTISKDTLIVIMKTLFGNDINKESIIISKLRLYICALKKCGVKVSQEIPHLLNSQFTSIDYVLSSDSDQNTYDIIVGNPPYVEDHLCDLKLKKKYGNIYANVLENSVDHLDKDGSIGFIIPISYCSTTRMKKIREHLISVLPQQYILSYADRPDCLFDSVHQKLNILIGKKTNGKPNLITGSYQYWYQEERDLLFSQTEVVNNDQLRDDCIPKLGNQMDKSIYLKITNVENPTVYSVSRNGEESVYVNRREAFWVKAYRRKIDHPEYKIFSYKTPEEADYCYCLVNSTLFWWYWICVSDCWHISKELNGFRAPEKFDKEKVKKLANALICKLEETKVFVGTKQTDYEYRHRSCLSEIQEIDDYINMLYGLTSDESSYIKGYALRYRVSGGVANNECN